MNIKEFISIINKTKSSLEQTGFIEIKVEGSYDGLTKTIYTDEKCHCCNRIKTETKLVVKFKNKTNLTIFQADMLFMILMENKKPRDYADYHKCIAGKEFIDNIESYKVVENLNYMIRQ